MTAVVLEQKLTSLPHQRCMGEIGASPSTDVQPRAEVTADEHFVPFMEKCSIWQHNTSQTGKKDTEIHA